MIYELQIIDGEYFKLTQTRAQLTYSVHIFQLPLTIFVPRKIVSKCKFTLNKRRRTFIENLQQASSFSVVLRALPLFKNA